jgi:hypothetical protein
MSPADRRVAAGALGALAALFLLTDLRAVWATPTLGWWGPAVLWVFLLAVAGLVSWLDDA